MSRYGQTYKPSTDIMYFEPGKNSDVRMISFNLTENISTDKYQGSALDVEWEKNGSVVNIRKFPVDEANVNPKEIPVPKSEGGQKGEKRMQTQDEALDEAYGKLKNWIKHVVTNYNHLLPEEKRNKFDEETTKAGSFEDLVKIAKSLLPTDFSKYKGELIVHYSGNFLTPPNELYITGHFWKVEGSNKVLQVLTRDSKPKKGYLNLDPPVQVDSKPADTPAQDTDW